MLIQGDVDVYFSGQVALFSCEKKIMGRLAIRRLGLDVLLLSISCYNRRSYDMHGVEYSCSIRSILINACFHSVSFQFTSTVARNHRTPRNERSGTRQRRRHYTKWMYYVLPCFCDAALLNQVVLLYGIETIALRNGEARRIFL